MTRHFQWCASPLGELLLAASDRGITDVHLRAGKYVPAIQRDWVEAPRNPMLLELQRELDAYFAGDLRQFRVALDPQGTEFQKRAWAALAAIPYGETRTYGQQAVAIGRYKFARSRGGERPRPRQGLPIRGFNKEEPFPLNRQIESAPGLADASL